MTEVFAHTHIHTHTHTHTHSHTHTHTHSHTHTHTLTHSQDRAAIITIHTQHWCPRLKPSFITQLSEQTVGYCGADIKSLCTEAALSALRRTYPQIYETGDKLVLDVTAINVTATDFFSALGRIVPTARRSESSCARALSREVAPLLLGVLKAILDMVEIVFNPSWAAVDKARRGLNVSVCVCVYLGKIELKSVCVCVCVCVCV